MSGKSVLCALVLSLCANFAWSADVPVPEFFGTYAVFGDKLLGLDVSASTAEPKMVSVEFALASNPVDLGNGAAAVSKRVFQVPEAPSTIKFIVFIQSSGMLTSMVAAKDMKLMACPYVRTLNNNSGWPSNVRRSGYANAWYPLSGNQIELLLKPVPNHSDMVIAQPAKALAPGVYVVSGGPLRTYFKFAVGSVESAKETQCVNLNCLWPIGGPVEGPDCKESKCGVGEAGSTASQESSGSRQAQGSAPQSAAGRTGIGMIVIVKDAPIYPTSDESKIVVRAPVGAPLAGAKGGFLGVPSKFQREEKNGRVHVFYFGGAGGVSMGWVDSSNVATFDYDCSCAKVPERCVAYEEKGFPKAGWNSCFKTQLEQKRSELFTADGQLKNGPRG